MEITDDKNRVAQKKRSGR